MFLRATSETLLVPAPNGGGSTEEIAMNGYVQDPHTALRMARMISEERIRSAREVRTARDISRAKRDRERETTSSRSGARRVFWMVGLRARRA